MGKKIPYGVCDSMVRAPLVAYAPLPISNRNIKKFIIGVTTASMLQKDTKGLLTVASSASTPATSLEISTGIIWIRIEVATDDPEFGRF